MRLPAPSSLRRSRAALPPAALLIAFAPITALLLVAGPVLGQADETPPTVESDTVDGTTPTLTFSENLKAANTSGLRFAFSVDGIIEGTGIGINSASISGRTLTLVLGAGAEADDTLTVNYDAHGAEQKLQDPAGNLVASFTGQAVRNAAQQEMSVLHISTVHRRKEA